MRIRVFIIRLQYVPENADSIGIIALRTLQSRDCTLQFFTVFGTGNITPSLVHVEPDNFTGADEVNFLHMVYKVHISIITIQKLIDQRQIWYLWCSRGYKIIELCDGQSLHLCISFQ